MSSLVLMAGSALTAIVAIPCLYGTWMILNEDKNTPSATESIGLALLATALAGVLRVLVRPRTKLREGQVAQGVSRKRAQPAELVGYSLIVSAMCFALFGLLIPFLNAVSEGERFFPNTSFGDFSDLVTRWVAFLSFMIGTVTLIIALTFGPFLFLADSLARKGEKGDQSSASHGG